MLELWQLNIHNNIWVSHIFVFKKLSSLLVVILTQNKSIKPNCVDWKRSRYIVFTTKRLKWVSLDLAPKPTSWPPPLEENDACQKWKRDDEMAKCNTLRSLKSIYVATTTLVLCHCIWHPLQLAWDFEGQGTS